MAPTDSVSCLALQPQFPSLLGGALPRSIPVFHLPPDKTNQSLKLLQQCLLLCCSRFHSLPAVGGLCLCLPLIVPNFLPDFPPKELSFAFSRKPDIN